MKLRHLIALLAVTLCFASVSAEPNDGKIAAAITLRHAVPSGVMWNLGLFKMDDLKSGNTSMWRAGKAGALPGIDLVVPCDSEHVLVVYGEKNAVEKLKSTVSSLDVVPRQLQVKAEFVTVRTDAQKKLGIDKGFADEIGKPMIDGIRQSIADGGAELMSSPIISTVENVPANIAISSEAGATRLLVLPKINADGTISLITDMSLTETAPERSQSLFTQRRLANGETSLYGGFRSHSDEDGMLVVLLTARTID